AESVVSPVTVSCLGQSATLTVTTTDLDPVVEGGPAGLDIELGNPSLAGIDPNINTVVATFPLPTQPAHASGSFTGGNVTSSYSIDANNNMVITTNGNGMLSSQLQSPVIHIAGIAAAGTGGQTMQWKTLQSFAINLSLGGTPIAVTCTPSDLNQ